MINVRELVHGQPCDCGHDGYFNTVSESWKGYIVSCPRCLKFHFLARAWWEVPLQKAVNTVRTIWGIIFWAILLLSVIASFFW